MNNYKIQNSKVLILILSFLVMSELALSQDEISLKNGKSVKGKILEQDFQNNTLKILSTDNKLIEIYKLDEIEKITTPFKPNYLYRLLFNYTKVGYISDGSSIFIANVAGIRVTPHFLLGVGFELRQKTNAASSRCPSYDYLPIYADIRFLTSKKPLAATIFTDLGYAFYTSNDNYSGALTGSLGGGIRVKINNDMALILEAGLHIQQYSYSNETKRLDEGSNQGNYRSSSTSLIPLGLFIEAGISF